MTRLGRLLMTLPLVALTVATAADTNWRTFLNNGRPAPKTVSIPKEPVELVGQLRGSVETSRVAVIEFGDFQCPFSRAFTREVQPELFRDYVDTGQVVWSFRHLPLTAIHSQARSAAELSECVAPRAGFWPVHDALFARWQGASLDTLDLSDLPGLDPTSVQSCLRRSQPAVDRDLREAAALSVTVTPTFLIGSVHNGRVTVEEVITGRVAIERYRKAIDRILTRVGALTPSSAGAARSDEK
jgi:protein-disulfide isomerase